MNENKKPVAKLTRGSIQIAIWADRGKYGIFYKLTASRRYKKSDSWKKTNSFVEDDALILSKAFADAFDVIRKSFEPKNEVKDSRNKLKRNPR